MQFKESRIKKLFRTSNKVLSLDKFPNAISWIWKELKARLKFFKSRVYCKFMKNKLRNENWRELF